MATSLVSDFKIIDPILQAGYVETLAQASDAFNAASASTLVMEAPESKTGHYEREAFFQAIAGGGVSRRDITSIAAAVAAKMTQGEFIGVKLNRKVGPVESTLDALRKIGADVETLSFALGAQVAKGQIVDALNSTIAALCGALSNTAAVLTNVSAIGAGTMTHNHLVSGLATLGDRSSEVSAFVMHSKAYHDLVGQAITDKVVEVAGTTIIGGNVASLGRPVVLVDAPALLIAGAPNNYLTLGLRKGAASIKMTEPMALLNQLVTGNEQLIQRFQGEYAYTLKILGFQWDIANGGVNPDPTAIALGTNWDQVLTSVKDCAGMVIRSK